MTETRPWSIPQPPADVPFVHHVSDTHIGYRPWSYAESDHMQRDVLDNLVPPPDLFVHTGDVVDNAAPAEDAYALPWLHRMARGARDLVAVGNHDLRDRVVHTRAEWERIYRRSANSFVDVKGIRFVAFAGPDSFTGLATPWIVPAATWDWLNTVVSTASGPVVLVDHYPPSELGVTPENYLQPVSTFDTFVGDHPAVIGMMCGHMHFGLADPNAVSFQTIGGRSIPVLSDISSMLSDIIGRDQSAQMQSYSAYVTMRETQWEIRYRAHGTHAWSGPDDQRLTTLDLVGNTVTRSM
jgi:hypothetical protein